MDLIIKKQITKDNWIYFIAAGLVLAVAYVVFKMKYYFLHEEYLASPKHE